MELEIQCVKIYGDEWITDDHYWNSLNKYGERSDRNSDNDNKSYDELVNIAKTRPNITETIARSKSRIQLLDLIRNTEPSSQKKKHIEDKLWKTELELDVHG